MSRYHVPALAWEQEALESMVRKILQMLAWSLRMDYILLFHIPGISGNECFKFILLKYYSYLKDSLLGLPRGGGSISVFGRRYHYPDKFGLASLQRIYCEHYGLRRFVGADPVVMDIGAHIGQFNFFCTHYLKARRVISMEPIPDCFNMLKMNALDEQDCINKAAGGDRNTVTMYVSQASTQQSSYVKSASDTYGGQCDVAVETLDSLLSRTAVAGDVDVLKIDTEGSEYEILCHAEMVLHRARVVAVEMSVLRESTGSLFKTGHLLEERGFVLQEFDSFKVLNTTAANGVFVRGPV